MILKSDARGEREIDDHVVVEEPLEIRVGGESLGVTMRTPGDDLDLAAGFLLTEGWVTCLEDIGTLSYCPDDEDPDLRNIVEAQLTSSPPPVRATRATWASSSCGLCGKATLESIRQNCQSIETSVRVSRQVLLSLPMALAQRQANFKETGGIHAAGLFSAKGTCLGVREDIGRHNAVDKVIGAALSEGWLGEAASLMVSGRLGFEIAQKALMARVPIVASVSAPSSLAIELASEFGLTAVGFLRGDSMNIYSHPERITSRNMEGQRRILRAGR